MATVNAYLTFNGDCEAAFTLYQSVFGGDFSFFGRFSDMPPQEGQPPLSETDGNKIMHVALNISKETCLFGSDTFGEHAAGFVAGNNFSISINTDSQAEADKLFASLSAGGKITQPIGDTFWGAYFGMFTDRFGVNWMVNYDRPQPTVNE
jgi:PhnB protein